MIVLICLQIYLLSSPQECNFQEGRDLKKSISVSDFPVPSPVPGTRRALSTHVAERRNRISLDRSRAGRAEACHRWGAHAARGALPRLRGRVWVAGVRGRARQRARAPSGEQQPAPRRTQRLPARQLGGGWAVQPARPRGPHWPPAGRPPPGRRRGAYGLLQSRVGDPRRADARANARARVPHPLVLCALAATRRVPSAGAHGRLPTALRRDSG